MKSLENEKEIHKKLMRLDYLEHKLNRWIELLKMENINSKGMVLNDMIFAKEIRNEASST